VAWVVVNGRDVACNVSTNPSSAGEIGIGWPRRGMERVSISKIFRIFVV
jgi:hypothetical protein